MIWDVIVKDAHGFTFGFSYEARTAAAAIVAFKKRARRAGVRKFKNIRILSVTPVRGYIRG